MTSNDTDVSDSRPARDTISLLRHGLLIVLVIGLAGTAVELYLLRHTDGTWQLAPLVLIGLAVVALAWLAVTRGALAVRALQVVMILFVVSGAVGGWMHFDGNLIHEAESDPSVSGTALYLRAIQGSSPTLAAGTMIQLGLVGLLYAFRHPSLPRSPRDASPN